MHRQLNSLQDGVVPGASEMIERAEAAMAASARRSKSKGGAVEEPVVELYIRLPQVIYSWIQWKTIGKPSENGGLMRFYGIYSLVGGDWNMTFFYFPIFIGNGTII